MIKKKGLVIYPEELTDYWVDRFLATDLNLLGLHPAGGITAGRTVEGIIEWSKKLENQRLLGRLTDRGIDVEHELHAISWLLPRELFGRRPKWFRMDKNGNRTADYHFCHSNPDALEQISERAKKLAAILVPTTGRYHFWLDDTDWDCHCPRCLELGYSPSDTAMMIFNRILDGIRAFNPRAEQCYLGYHISYSPPEKIKPSDGIFLEYAPMSKDLYGKEYKRSVEDSVSMAELDDLLKVFSKRNSKILDYWLDNSWHLGWKKPAKKFSFQPETAAKEIKFYAEKGFESITCFACYLGEEYYLEYNEHADIGAYARCFER
ncbi:MAG: DUF4838 domain-containing protein [Firmicutes bacterium]|nr:DUF4838 domain-containing protein [Bacillota bacterium]